MSQHLAMFPDPPSDRHVLFCETCMCYCYVIDILLCTHTQVAQLGNRERKEENQQSKKKGNNWMLHLFL